MGEELVHITERAQRKFLKNPTVRLINPAKKELGKISKVILGKINKNIE